MDTQPPKKIAIIGGGAAGFFTALTLKEKNPQTQIALFEKRNDWLTKVKISGGGRCNVTHFCFDPEELSKKYPRGAKELRAAFYKWQPSDMIEWFSDRNISLKNEADGRMFPTTDDSQTIINCFMEEAEGSQINLRKGFGIENFFLEEAGSFSVKIKDSETESFDALCLTTGSLKGSLLEQSIKKLGHSIEPLAPSLFAFNVNDKRLKSLAGISVPSAEVWIDSKHSLQSGPLLITHRGMSGPAILKLSAWEARNLQNKGYHFDFYVNWLADETEGSIKEQFDRNRDSQGKKTIRNTPLLKLPKRLWESLVEYSKISAETTWAQLSKDLEQTLINEILSGQFKAQGKTTNKDEFVTCGGVHRKDINFKTMESKYVPNLFFAGECIDIDGITGGFNFQAAWTTGRLAGTALAQI